MMLTGKRSDPKSATSVHAPQKAMGCAVMQTQSLNLQQHKTYKTR